MAAHRSSTFAAVIKRLEFTDFKAFHSLDLELGL